MSSPNNKKSQFGKRDLSPPFSREFDCIVNGSGDRSLFPACDFLLFDELNQFLLAKSATPNSRTREAEHQQRETPGVRIRKMDSLLRGSSSPIRSPHTVLWFVISVELDSSRVAINSRQSTDSTSHIRGYRNAVQGEVILLSFTCRHARSQGAFITVDAKHRPQATNPPDLA